MQLHLNTVLLTAAAVSLPLAHAAKECRTATAKPIPSSVSKDFAKMREAVQKVGRVQMDGVEFALGEGFPLGDRRDREEWVIPCKNTDLCVFFEGVPMCFDEDTCVLRTGGNIYANLKTGDMLLPDDTQANVYTNTKPITDFVRRRGEEAMRDYASEIEKITDGDLTMYVKTTMSARSEGSGSATSAVATAAAATGSAAPSAATASSGAASSSAAAASGSAEATGESAAGKMVGGGAGGWVAAAAAAVAVVIVV